MSIKTRLLLSYIAMTVIPAILFALIAWGLSSALFPDAARTGDGKPAFREKFERRNERLPESGSWLIRIRNGLPTESS